MTWLIVKYREDKAQRYAKIAANQMVRDESIIYAYNDVNLVGVFDLGVVDMAYISKEENHD